LVTLSDSAPTYVGQVECDSTGTLWAVLYFRDQVVERERVRSLRHGKRRVTNMVLAAQDSFPEDPRPPAPVPMNRMLVERRPSARRGPIGVSAMAARP
jgi:hypothetical protein